MIERFGFGLVVVLGAVLGGCGGEDSRPEYLGNAGTGAGGGSGGSGGSGASGGAAAAGGTSAELLTAPLGIVEAANLNDYAGARASFFEFYAETEDSEFPYVEQTACGILQVGSCRVTKSCLDFEVAEFAPQAGPIQVGSFELLPDPENGDRYRGSGIADWSFPPGEAVTFNALGGDVPAFSGAVVMPPNFVVTAPVEKNGGYTISLGTDLVVSWTGGGVGSTFVQIYGWNLADYTAIDCEFEAASGSGSVPAAVLGHLHGYLDHGSLSIGERASKRVSAGQFDVLLVATTWVVEAPAGFN